MVKKQRGILKAYRSRKRALKRTLMKRPNPTRSHVFRHINQIFPDTYRVKAKTIMDFTSSTFAGNATYFAVVKANSIYNVGISNVTNTMPTSGTTFAANVPGGLYYLLGSQGGGSAPYGRARVYTSKISVTIAANTTNSQNNTKICIFPTNDLYNFSGYSYQTLEEEPFCKKSFIGNWASNSAVTRIANSIATQKFFGLKHELMLETDNYTQLFNTDPVNCIYWVIAIQNADGAGGAVQSFNGTITLVQDVELFDRNAQTSSAYI